MGAIGAKAQLRTSYFMEGSTFRYDMNPALAPVRGYIKLPALGGIGVSANLGPYCVKNFLYNVNGQTVTFMNGGVDADKFLRRLHRNNGMGIDLSTSVLGVADYSKRYFWSFDLNLRVMADASIPKDFFRVLKTMSQGTYDVSGVRIDANAFLEASVGFAVPVNSWVTVGGKFKGLLGVASATAHIDQLTIDINEDKCSATAHGFLEGNVSGFDFSDLEGSEFDLSKLSSSINMSNFAPSNIKNGGFALDLGADVRLFDNHLKVSAAVVDLGWVWYKSASGFRGETNNITASFEGYDFDSKEIKTSYDDIKFNGRASQNTVQRLNTTLNIGAEYAMLHNAIGVGLLSHTKFYQSYTYSELTASVNFRASDWFSFSLSHSFINNGWASLGCAINFHPAGFNFFLGTDCLSFRYSDVKVKGTNIPVPIDNIDASVYFGISFSLHKAHYGQTIHEMRLAKKEARQSRRE